MKSILTRLLAVASIALSITFVSCGKEDIEDYFTITYYSPDVDVTLPGSPNNNGSSYTILKAGTVLTLKELPILSAEGYTFKGWFDKEGQKYEPFTRFISKGISLYARFDPKTYVLTLDANGGTLPEDKEEKDYSFDCTFGIAKTLPEVDFIAPSTKQFKEWNTKSDGSGTSYEDKYDSFLITAQDMKLYAIWEDTPASE